MWPHGAWSQHRSACVFTNIQRKSSLEDHKITNPPMYTQDAAQFQYRGVQILIDLHIDIIDSSPETHN